MAAKKDSPKGYDRWDTVSGTIKGTGKLTPAQKKAVAAAKKEQGKSKKK